MKNPAYLILCSCMLAACQTGGKHTVTGQMENLGNDTLIVYSRLAGSDSDGKADTVVAENGKFAFDIDNTSMQEIIIRANENMPNKDVTFLLLPGQNVKLEGSMSEPVFSGGEFYEDMNTARKMSEKYTSKIDSIIQICLDMEDKGIAEDSIMKVYQPVEAIAEALEQEIADYIAGNPSKDISVYLLQQLSHENMGKCIDAIDENVKQGVMAPFYKAIEEEFNKEEKRLEAEKRIQPGNPAPDFTLKDINGNDFTLSSLKGKYVVLDFWGSWCRWCIKGIPDMKEAYSKYKNKVEFVGIDCRDTEEQWLKAVKDYELPWINVRNEDKDNIPSTYAIKGYPTKIVIDKEGNIVKIVIGEDPEFYKFLKELLG